MQQNFTLGKTLSKILCIIMLLLFAGNSHAQDPEIPTVVSPDDGGTPISPDIDEYYAAWDEECSGIAFPFAGAIDPETGAWDYTDPSIRDGYGFLASDYTIFGVHPSMDIIASYGQPISAGGYGRVVHSGGASSGYESLGGVVTVCYNEPSSPDYDENAPEYCVRYSHLDSTALAVSDGDMVRPGDTLGIVGDYGQMLTNAGMDATGAVDHVDISVSVSDELGYNILRDHPDSFIWPSHSNLLNFQSYNDCLAAGKSQRQCATEWVEDYFVDPLLIFQDATCSVKVETPIGEPIEEISTSTGRCSAPQLDLKCVPDGIDPLINPIDGGLDVSGARMLHGANSTCFNYKHTKVWTNNHPATDFLNPLISIRDTPGETPNYNAEYGEDEFVWPHRNYYYRSSFYKGTYSLLDLDSRKYNMMQVTVPSALDFDCPKTLPRHPEFPHRINPGDDPYLQKKALDRCVDAYIVKKREEIPNLDLNETYSPPKIKPVALDGAWAQGAPADEVDERWCQPLIIKAKNPHDYPHVERIYDVDNNVDKLGGDATVDTGIYEFPTSKPILGNDDGLSGRNKVAFSYTAKMPGIQPNLGWGKKAGSWVYCHHGFDGTDSADKSPVDVLYSRIEMRNHCYGLDGRNPGSGYNNSTFDGCVCCIAKCINCRHDCDSYCASRGEDRDECECRQCRPWEWNCSECISVKQCCMNAEKAYHIEDDIHIYNNLNKIGGNKAIAPIHDPYQNELRNPFRYNQHRNVLKLREQNKAWRGPPYFPFTEIPRGFYFNNAYVDAKNRLYVTAWWVFTDRHKTLSYFPRHKTHGIYWHGGKANSLKPYPIWWDRGGGRDHNVGGKQCINPKASGNVSPNDTIVGIGTPGHNCGYGDWESLKLYQARCMHYFGANCLCKYEKTFKNGSAEEYVLKKGGAFVPRLNRFDRKYDDGTPIVEMRIWPLGWRGYVSSPAFMHSYGAMPLNTGGQFWHFNGNFNGELCERFPHKSGIANGCEQSLNGSPTLFPIISAYLRDKRAALQRYFMAGAIGVHKGAASINDQASYGLDEALPGDIIIWDDNMYKSGSSPANLEFNRKHKRLPHVAFVEEVNNEEWYDFAEAAGLELAKKEPQNWIKISEYNNGKFPDICGNTDRWGMRTERIIYKDPLPHTDPEGEELICADSDYRECYEPLWDRIKIYRPVRDVRRTGCNAALDDPAITPAEIMRFKDAGGAPDIAKRIQYLEMIEEDIEMGCDPPLHWRGDFLGMNPGRNVGHIFPVFEGTSVFKKPPMSDVRAGLDSDSPVGAPAPTKTNPFANIPTSPYISSGGGDAPSEPYTPAAGSPEQLAECADETQKIDGSAAGDKIANCSAGGDTGFCECPDPANGSCCINNNPPACFFGNNSCDAVGVADRDQGYSRDYVAQYLASIGFLPDFTGTHIPENMNLDPATDLAKWEVLKRWLPKYWLIKEESCDGADVYQENEFLRKGRFSNHNLIVPGQTIAIIQNCHYPRGHAGIVNLYDKDNGCVYVTSRNWLQDSCQQTNENNCFQAGLKFSNGDPINWSADPPVSEFINGRDEIYIPQTSSCLPVERFSTFINLKQDNGSGSYVDFTGNLPTQQDDWILYQSQCEATTPNITSCNQLCNNGFETYCDR